MYTIIIDDNNNLTTSIRTNLLRHTTTDEVQVLYKPDIEEVIPEKFQAILYYREKNGITKLEDLQTDAELYKDRIRFFIPTGSAFFNNRGELEVWIEVDYFNEVVDEETGEITRNVISFITRTTTIFIEEVPHNAPRRCEGNAILITRGDTMTITLVLTDDTGYPYELHEGDIVYFRVKKSAMAEDVLIEKVINNEDLTTELVEADTRDLAFGKYRYEVEVVTVEDDHYTVIKNAPFIITEELH